MSYPRIPLVWVDAFSDRPYAGNPAAVCMLEGPAPVEAMQALASEMGLSETAFIWPLSGGFSLRWFTPVAEVDLCGHATVAAAHALASSGRLGGREVRFMTNSGELLASVDGDRVEIDLPAEVPNACEVPGALAERWPVLGAFSGKFDLVVVVADEAAVREADPDADEIAALPYRGVAVSAWGADYVLRYFAPRLGVPEDPVTGSVQCLLGPYWATSLGRSQLRARQLSKRGGSFDVIVDGPRVRVGGRASSILAGTLSEAVAATLGG